MKKIFLAAWFTPMMAFAQTYPSPTFQNVTINGNAAFATLSSTGLATLNGLSLTMPLAIASGGTGQTTAADSAHALGVGTTDTPTFYGITLNGSTAHGLIVGGGNGNPATYTIAGTAGQVLVSNGPTSDPTFQALSSSGIIASYNGIATVANGIPAEYAQVNLTAQTASVASATLYAVPSSGAGFYLAIVDTICTTAGTAGTVSATIGWNNGSAAATAASGAMSLSTLGNETTQIFTVYSAAIQNITYSTTVSGAAGSPQYAVRIRLVYLG